MTTEDSLSLHVQLACLWEVTARKPGNVHRFCDFEDTKYLDFVYSATALGLTLRRAEYDSVGDLVEASIRQTRSLTGTNTNMGIVLLFAPLARAGLHPNYRDNVESVLAALSVADSIAVYRAIRLARPAGLGRVGEGDISSEPNRPLRELMALAADRDLIARQYSNGFAEVFEAGCPLVLEGMSATGCLEGAIQFAHLHLLARYPDTLIARKRGTVIAKQAALFARRVLDAGWPDASTGRMALTELDAWLRADGHAHNPGTTADVVAASLFVLLRTGQLALPLQLPWSKDSR